MPCSCSAARTGHHQRGPGHVRPMQAAAPNAHKWPIWRSEHDRPTSQPPARTRRSGTRRPGVTAHAVWLARSARRCPGMPIPGISTGCREQPARGGYRAAAAAPRAPAPAAGRDATWRVGPGRLEAAGTRHPGLVSRIEVVPTYHTSNQAFIGQPEVREARMAALREAFAQTARILREPG
jgi:hypothetical protein